MKAGSLYHRFAFEKRISSSDGMGNTVDAWAEQFRCHGSRLIMRGGETVMAARLEGRKPVVVTVRSEARTRLVDSDWRVVDVRTLEAFNIRSVQPSEKRDAIEFMCEFGVALG